MSMALMWLGEVAEILTTSPPSPSMMGRYSDSGSIQIISSSVDKASAASSRLAVKDLPEPETPRMKPWAIEEILAVGQDQKILADGVLTPQ